MKKLLFILIISLFFLPVLYAGGNSEKDNKGEVNSISEEIPAHNNEAVSADEESSSDENADEEKKKRKRSGISDRIVEITLFHADVFFANNLISAFDVFKETIEFNFDDLSKGLRFNMGAMIDLPSFRFKSKKGWGFGLYTKAEVYGVVDIAGEMLRLQTADNAKSVLSGAAFASASVDAFFPVNKFTLKIKPSVYYTLMYIKPEINYTFNKENGIILDLNYDIMAYTPFPLNGEGFSLSALSAKPGADISLGFEYPISRAIGLYNKKPFLDFDIGVDIKQIPIVPSSMSDYMRVSGRIANDDPVTIEDNFDAIGKFIDDLGSNIYNSENGNETLRITRPFKTMLWTAWRPIGGKRILTLNFSVGFEINKMYDKLFSMEGGFGAKFNFGNIFMIAAAVNYTDRMWVNSLDLTFNFRVIQLDLGVNMRSQDFIQSWKGAGVGARVGMKIGW